MLVTADRDELELEELAPVTSIKKVAALAFVGISLSDARDNKLTEQHHSTTASVSYVC